MSKGLECPDCRSRLSRVLKTMQHRSRFYGQDFIRIRRRRRCSHCGYVYTTVETLEDDDNIGQPAQPQPPTQPDPKPTNPFLPGDA